MFLGRITLGDNVTIRFVASNTANQSLVYMATMTIGNCTVLIDIELGPNEAKTVSYVISPEKEGFYDVELDGLTGCFYVWPSEEKAARFEVTRLEVLTETEEGMDIPIFVTVSNVGDVEGTYQINLRLEGGDILFYTLYSKNVTLPGGTSEEVQICIEEGLTAGSYQVEVDELIGSFSVVSEPSFWDEIPGFPLKSTILGIAFGLLAVWVLHR